MLYMFVILSAYLYPQEIAKTSAQAETHTE